MTEKDKIEIISVETVAPLDFPGEIMWDCDWIVVFMQTWNRGGGGEAEVAQWMISDPSVLHYPSSG